MGSRSPRSKNKKRPGCVEEGRDFAEGGGPPSFSICPVLPSPFQLTVESLPSLDQAVASKTCILMRIQTPLEVQAYNFQVESEASESQCRTRLCTCGAGLNLDHGDWSTLPHIIGHVCVREHKHLIYTHIFPEIKKKNLPLKQFHCGENMDSTNASYIPEI